MAMLNPPHPGLSVKHDCIEALSLTVTRAAEVLDVTRQTLNDLVHCRRGISPEMAIRLDMAFGGGPILGCACRPPTISRRPARRPVPSRSSATSPL
ncbi:MAG: hypothetical protein USCGTAYLOR_02483 [Chromatiales bacterium USCg_Taylor]|nr:MAG: hypothetical protein USCGTAYLOR_02483 [Chromatiales bacterium USCg_Taylor]